jgi:hypothetical protein
MSSDQWLVLIASLPGPSGTLRMRVWRALKGGGAGILRDGVYGAGILRDGVYLLPAGTATEGLAREQAKQIQDAGGTAYVIDFTSDDGEQAETFQALFERSEDYRLWTDAVADLVKELRGMSEAEGRRRSARLRRELEAIVTIDYFPGSARERAEATLRELEAAVTARFSPDEPRPTEGVVPSRDPSEFQGRRWATRRRPWVDRVACAWLIRRFIDPEAQPSDCPDDAVGFDFDGATFSHVGDRVSFEVLLASFDLDDDAGLARIGALVHYLDVGGVPVPEADGFVTMLSGAKAARDDDDALLDAAGSLLDHLYAAYAGDPGR